MGFHNIPIGDKFPDIINVLVEIPKGTHNKYEYDEEVGVIRLDRVLHSPFYYPVDYGFVPETRAEDGDHTDVLIITDSPTFPGCLVEVRPLAVLRMVDDESQDDKIIAVPASNPSYRNVEKISDVSPHTLDVIRHFFEDYKKLEKKQIKIQGYGTMEDAIETLKAHHQAYKDEQSA